MLREKIYHSFLKFALLEWGWLVSASAPVPGHATLVASSQVIKANARVLPGRRTFEDREIHVPRGLVGGLHDSACILSPLGLLDHGSSALKSQRLMLKIYEVSHCSCRLNSHLHLTGYLVDLEGSYGSRVVGTVVVEAIGRAADSLPKCRRQIAQRAGPSGW